MKKYFFIVLTIIVPLGAIAQTEKGSIKKNLKANVTLASMHLWRAMPSSTVPSIEPSFTWTYKGFGMGTWAAYSVDKKYKEIDFYLTWRKKFFEFGVYDYYCPVPGTKIPFDNFEYGKTEHSIEVQGIFYLLPAYNLKLTSAFFAAGADWNFVLSAAGDTAKIEQRYSTYFEAAYDINYKGFTITPEIGLTPFKGMYADKFSVFNYALAVRKKIRISDKFSVSTVYKLVYSSELKDCNFYFGLEL